MLKNNIYISLITGISGILIGFILNQAVAYHKAKKEDNRIRNEAIFYLLEFRYLLSRVDFEKIYPSIIYALIDILPTNLKKETSNIDLSKILKPYIYPILAKSLNTTSRKYNELAKNFKTIIVKLSSINPQQAYTLSGKEDIISHLSELEEYFKTVTDNNKAIDESVIEDVSQILNTTAINDSIKDIEDLLLVLQKKNYRPLAKKRHEKMLSRFSTNINHDKEEYKRVLAPILEQLQNI